MKRFMLLYVGPPPPPEASHEGWPEWFGKLGGNLVDKGSPMADGLVLHDDGSASGSAARLNGYSIIQAENIAHVRTLVNDHPNLALGHKYTIEVYSLP